MARYAFRAQEPSGRVVTGHREGSSRQSVAQDLAGDGLTPIRVEPDDPLATPDSADKGLNRALFAPGVKLDEVVLLSRQLHSLTRAGVTAVRAYRGLAESGRNPTLKAALNDVADNLEAGSDLATSLRRHPKIFSELYASVILVGENTGRLEEAFLRISEYLELERDTIKRVKAGDSLSIVCVDCNFDCHRCPESVRHTCLCGRVQ